MNKAKTIARNLRCCGERESCNNCSYKSQSKTRCFDLIKIAGADELERLNEETIMLRKINAQLTIENNKLKEKLK